MKNISMNVVRRLPKYHRCLSELLEKGEDRISSSQLGEMTGFTSSQIRQDLNNFGGFGKQGYGYDVNALYESVSEILGLTTFHNAIIIGAGNLGQAIANYQAFRKYCLNLKAIFDVDSKIIGKKINGLEVLHISELETIVKREKISIAVITTPKTVAFEIAQNLMSFKTIEGIWNFAPIDIEGNDKVFVENVSLLDSLYVLSFMIKNKN